LGHQGILAIGSGTLRIENTRVLSASSFVSFRRDYGSTWNGNLYIINSSFFPPLNNLSGVSIVATNNNGQWDFLLPVTMPHTITIDGFYVMDGGIENSGIQLVTNPGIGTALTGPFPYALTETIFIRNYSSTSETPWRHFTNNIFIDNINVVEQW